MEIFKLTVTMENDFDLSYCAHDDDFEFLGKPSAEELEFMLRLRQFIIDEESRVEIKPEPALTGDGEKL